MAHGPLVHYTFLARETYLFCLLLLINFPKSTTKCIGELNTGIILNHLPKCEHAEKIYEILENLGLRTQMGVFMHFST